MRGIWGATVALLLAGGISAGGSAGEQVGLLWEGKAANASAVAAAMVKTLKEKAPDIEVVTAAELPSKDLAAKRYKEWQNDKAAIVFLRSFGAETMGKNPPKVPGFCGACTNPVSLGCTSSLEKPDKNVSGVTYYIPAERALAIFMKIVPTAKTIGLVVEQKHPSARIDIEETQAWAAKNGVTVKVVSGSNNGELIKVCREIDGEVDFFVTGNQSQVGASSPLLVKILKKPVFSFYATTIDLKGTICALDISNEYLGAALAESVIAAVKDKKPVSEIPVKLDPNPQLKFVDEVVAKYGVTIPAELKK